MRTAQVSRRGCIFFEHLRESGAVGELSVSGIRVISAQEFTAFSDCIS